LRKYFHEVGPEHLHPHDKLLEIGDAQAIILGMGKIGRRAYTQLQTKYGISVLGIDNNEDTVARWQKEGYHLMEGDAVDSDFWEKLMLSDKVKYVILAMPHHAGNLYALQQLKGRTFHIRVAAIIDFPDEREPLLRRGADAVFDVYEEAGKALADDVVTDLRKSTPSLPSTPTAG